MAEIPSQEEVVNLLNKYWDIAPEAVSLWKSARVFRVNGFGIARIGFPHNGLTSGQQVALINQLNSAGCGVPSIVPTSTGDLFVELDKRTLSIEQELPGVDCSGVDLYILPNLGRALGKLHACMYEFKDVPGHVGSLHDWIDLTLKKAEKWAAEQDHDEYVRKLRSKIHNHHRDLQGRFGLTHGDIRGPNVLRNEMSVGFIDFKCKYEPQLSDIGRIRNKWLMNGDVQHERPLSTLEIAEVLNGYQEVYPLIPNDIEAFPVIWAVSQAWRLAQDLRIVGRFEIDRATNWPIHEQMRDLPMAIEVGESILQAASLKTTEV